MANPRQRKKSRAGNKGKPTGQALRRLHNKQNRAPPLKGPEVLQQKWDKSLTVFQNYAALGLLSSIPLPSSKPLPQPRFAGDADGLEKVVTGFGRIVRDEDGNVVDIILPDEDEEMEEETEGAVKKIEGKTDLVRSLESLSAQAQPVIRHTSLSEKEWLTQMVEKYGSDTEAMAGDLKMNVWQKTRGELGRMLKKAGGVEKLQRDVAARGGAMEL